MRNQSNPESQTIPQTESCRGKRVKHDRIGRLVTFKDLALHKRFVGCLGAKLGLDFLLSLAKGKGLRLSKEIAQQNFMVYPTSDRVERLAWGDEVGRDHLGALVNKLVERVLSISTSLSPNDGLNKGQDEPRYVCTNTSNHTPVSYPTRRPSLVTNLPMPRRSVLNITYGELEVTIALHVALLEVCALIRLATSRQSRL